MGGLCAVDSLERMALRRTASTRHQREAAVDPVAPCVLWGSPPALPNVHIIEVLPECGVLATASDFGGAQATYPCVHS